MIFFFITKCSNLPSSLNKFFCVYPQSPLYCFSVDLLSNPVNQKHLCGLESLDQVFFSFLVVFFFQIAYFSRDPTWYLKDKFIFASSPSFISIGFLKVGPLPLAYKNF